MPELDREQRRIVRLIRREGRNIRDPRARRVYERAAVQTGLVESGLRNLSYGDADSQGWRQERASLYKDPTNLRASIRRFREEFQQLYDPGEKSYEVAAQVQRPAEQYRGRYHDVANEAAQILRGSPSPGGPVSDSGPLYRTVPGVDNAATRQQLKQAYFLGNTHDPNALLQLKAGLDQAQDVPSRRVQIPRPGPATQGTGKRGDGIGGELLESFYNGPGGVNIKNGQRVSKGFVDGHTDHVHVAGGPKSVVALGRLAQQMGLRVSENPAFDKVDPVHTEGSYHYKNQAIDVSGDPKKMARFSRRVARLYGL